LEDVATVAKGNSHACTPAYRLDEKMAELSLVVKIRGAAGAGPKYIPVSD
jgi:hypothetical protein